MDRPGPVFGAAGHSRGHAEERIVWIDRPHRADFLHVIRAAANDAVIFENAFERLKIAQAIVAELFLQRWTVEVKPCRLNIHIDAEMGGRFNSLAAHKIGMTDAGKAGLKR